MPKRLHEGGYACSYCGKVYKNPLLADGCERAHGLVYIALPKEDLLRLIQFIYTGERKLLSENMVRRLTEFARAKETKDDVSVVPGSDWGG